ncbi:hypothetical protein HHL24_00095 [Paraburkholderia sp. RP-4-7]|uniref:Uncharacterized protein n=1 Tax=Paraburkholderia polaris TaxID=2728848 RepID=A0A848I8R8_9BURK|nr:hypothetical protein [Paraburkholderia polaris]NML96368.1 hypothetical protein [Paraburkholderia polaris]
MAPVDVYHAQSRKAKLAALTGDHDENNQTVTLDTTINQVNANFQVVTELLKSILDTKTVASLKQSADSLQQVTKASQTDKTIRIAVNMGPSGISFTDLATKINRDPSVVIRGTAQRPLGPGEEK